MIDRISTPVPAGGFWRRSVVETAAALLEENGRTLVAPMTMVPGSGGPVLGGQAGLPRAADLGAGGIEGKSLKRILSITQSARRGRASALPLPCDSSRNPFDRFQPQEVTIDQPSRECATLVPATAPAERVLTSPS